MIGLARWLVMLRERRRCWHHDRGSGVSYVEVGWHTDDGRRAFVCSHCQRVWLR